jgi:hypothetical protein
MSLADDAKLLLIPTGYKTSKVYSVFPTDGDGDFDYTRSGDASRVNPGGLIETVGTNIPRIDHFGGGCPTLLLEPQRTNLQVTSEEFNSGFWVKTRTTITANNAISPNGELTADKLTGDGTGTSYVYDGNSFTSGLNYAISIFVKPINVTTFVIQNFTEFGTATFDIQNGTLSGVSGSLISQDIENYGNGWYRCSAIYSCTSTGTKNIGYGLIDYGGDQFYLWGAQVEQGDYVSSYIKTTSGQITRQKDNCHLLNQTLFTDYPFTVYAKAKVDNFSNVAFSLIDSLASNKYLSIQFTSSSQIGVLRRDASNNDSDYYSFSYSIGDTLKIAISYVNDTSYKLYVNGTELADITSGTSIPFDHNDISLGQFRIASDTGTRNSIDDFRVYDYTLTNTELTELTTL